MQLGRRGQGGQSEARFGGVLQVGAGVGEVDEGHCCLVISEVAGRWGWVMGWILARGLDGVGCAQERGGVVAG